MTRTRVAAVGAFVLGGILLFGVGLFLIGDRRMLFEQNFEIYAEFAKIAGLQKGAIVRVAGMDAGEVETIHVPPGPAQPFRVKMRIRDALRPLIRVDSVASIQNDGLVGNKFMQVEAGSKQGEAVADGGTIRSREPFDLADVLEKMSETVETVNTMINDVHGRVDEAFGTLTAVAKDAQLLMNEFGADARPILAAARKVSADLETIVTNVRAGRGSVGQLVTDDSLYRSAKNIAAEAEKVMATVRKASEEAKAAISDFRGDGGPMKGVTGDLQETLAAARDAMTNLAESTEALKHNFFFRGFFNRRGFFDLDEVSVQEYRQGALATKDRRVFRIWLKANMLFEPDANGQERLTDAGRARLDSAMSQFVRYPKRSPFVVEGYAQVATFDERFLLSRHRAQVVRDYLVGKYALDANFVATMPMGEQADGSPEGDRWDGVGLAMFIATSAL
jgi:phospholipid/cholesterol/gamma-HCH transport system substrate-binding protein